MDHVNFGRSGLSVSRLCLGTMTFGLQCDEALSRSILDAAAEGGIDFLDTADVYPLGGDQWHSMTSASPAPMVSKPWPIAWVALTHAADVQITRPWTPK